MNKKVLTINLAKNVFLLLCFFVFFESCKPENGNHSQNVSQNTNSLEDHVKLFNSLEAKWLKEEENGKISRIELITLNGRKISNQVKRFKRNGQLDTLHSRFFDLQIDDTIYLGKNVGTVNSYTYNTDYDVVLSYVIVENHYSLSEIRLDTFGNNDKTVMFGIFAHETGKQLVKGELFEQYLLPKQTISEDSVQLDMIEVHSFFEKEVFVKDTLDRN